MISSQPITSVSLLLADINGDGKLDAIVMSNVFGNLITEILMGNGDGTFQSSTYSAVLSFPGGVAGAAAIADLNGDSKPDLVFTLNSEDLFFAMVALNLGNGTFAVPTQYAVNGTGAIAIGDMNGDGIPDIVTSGLAILYGDGKGAFPQRSDYLMNAANGLILTDFDGDGGMDVVAGSGSADLINGSAIAVLFGRGNETFLGPPVSPIPTLPSATDFLTAIAAADFNGDGIPDLVFASGGGNVSVLQGSGDGTFHSVFQSAAATGQTPFSIVTGDFNSDGRMDFAVGSGSPAGVYVFLGNGDGTFQKPLQAKGPAGLTSMVAGDFNGDGKLDLAVVGNPNLPLANSVAILLGNGDGTFRTGASYPAGPSATAIIAGDFNGDGKLDLVVANSGTDENHHRDGNLLLLSGKGDGTFVAQPPIMLPSGFDGAPYTIASADFNGDGKPDLALSLLGASLDAGGIAVLLGNGNGTFQSPVPYASDSFFVQTGDLNGDGIPDLIVPVGYLLGNGDGAFQPQVTFQPQSESSDSLFLQVTADFNRDGKLDIANAGLVPGGVAVFLNTSQAEPAISVVSAASLEPGPLAPGSLATIFGSNLAAAQGTSVSIQDSSGVAHTASLLYVSPRQVNFVVPDGTLAGSATLSVTPANGTAQTVAIEITPVAPALFSIGSGGVAAGYVVIAAANGTQTVEPLFQLQGAAPIAVPVSLGPVSGQAYLVLYGTGLRGAQGAVAVTIQGQDATVTYAGAQSQFPGLDQVNVLIPTALAGTGLAAVQLTAGDVTSNLVYLEIE